MTNGQEVFFFFFLLDDPEKLQRFFAFSFRFIEPELTLRLLHDGVELTICRLFWRQGNGLVRRYAFGGEWNLDGI